MACVIIALVIISINIYQRLSPKHICEHKTVSDLVKEDFAQVRGGDNYYKVHEDLDNPQGAAETMNKLNTIAMTLINYLEHKYNSIENIRYHIKPEYVSTVQDGIRALKRNYKTASLEENIPERSGGDTSYVIDKGAVFAMCLRDPKNNNQLDDKINGLVFVLVHEMSHLFTRTYGHDASFWNNFRFMLKEASNIGVYTPINYNRTGSPYCGIVITYSPLFDSNLIDYFVHE